MQAGQSLPLGGCRLLVDKSSIRVTRELKAAQSQVLATSLWDQRWQFLGPDLAKLKAGPLGAAGLLKCTNWRESGFPRVSLLASPALWCKDELMSAPFAGNTNNYSLSLASEQKGFFLSLLSY
jgi:tRNA(Ile)-lysidine synthase